MITVQFASDAVESEAVTNSRERLPDNVVTFIVVARHGGMSYARIASLMNRIGLPAARGGCWHGSTVARVARRHGPAAIIRPPVHRRAS